MLKKTKGERKLYFVLYTAFVIGTLYRTGRVMLGFGHASNYILLFEKLAADDFFWSARFVQTAADCR